MTKQNRIAILDAGGQYIDLVRKAIERQGVEAEVLPLITPARELEQTYRAIVISGSPASSATESAPLPDRALWQTKLPLLGICYGMQSMAVACGGEVARNAIREDGRVMTLVDAGHPLFDGCKQEFSGLFTHGDFVTRVPEGFRVIGSHELSDGKQAFSAIAKDNLLGVQFHPEVFDDTPEGYQVFKNFITIAKVKPDPAFQARRLKRQLTNKVGQIRSLAAEKHVIAFVSGGVDSSVCIALASKAISKDKLHAYYIDHGFMRDEDDRVVESLKSAGIPVTKVDAAESFEKASIDIDGVKYGPLSEIVDPELKRKIIGKSFIDLQNQLVRDLKLKDAMLLQGTNAADRIESGHSYGDNNTMTIKTHHNQVKEVRQLKEEGRLIEPIDDLFKDEVRSLGRELGLPEELVERQPFPGPGLAIRIIASAKGGPDIPEHQEQARINDHIHKRYPEVNARLLPIKSVGVGGDERSHLSVIALENTGLNQEQLAELGSVLPANFRELANRVIYSLVPGRLDNIHLSKTLLASEERQLLRKADSIVFESMRQAELLREITQFPVVLLPLSFNEPGRRSIVFRPVKTTTFMTVQAMLPGRDLPEGFIENVASRIIKALPGVSQVFLDLTNKPPATTEWE